MGLKYLHLYFCVGGWYMLKSDQNGIEMRHGEKLVKNTRKLKSDQNGIEI